MGNGNKNNFGTTYSYAVVVRGQLPEINKLMEFLKASELVIAHDEIGQEKLWIKKDGD